MLIWSVLNAHSLLSECQFSVLKEFDVRTLKTVMFMKISQFEKFLIKTCVFHQPIELVKHNF
jgi:hypothetical protein